MKLDKDLPAWQRLQRKLAQQKLRRETVALQDVRRLPLNRHNLAGGTLDWTVSSNPLEDDYFYDLTAGGMNLGGDLTIADSGTAGRGFESERFNPKWHYYFEDFNWITQAEVGDVITSGPLARSLDGGRVTNRPQVQRTYFQTLRLNGYLGEGWEVELYVDNRLTDFMYTDQNGEYNFNVDIVYGSSLITLKMYGPNGEIRTEEQYVTIPYNLIPRNAIEYTLAAGQATRGRETGWFTQASGYYGVLENLTAGVAADLPVAEADSSQFTAAVDLTYQPLGNLTINSAFAPDYKASVAMNYSQLSVLSLNAEATRYFENPIRNITNREYSLSFSASAPLRIKGRYFGLRYNVLHEARPSTQTTSMSYGLSAGLP
jgi:hypothetical protein